MTRNRTIRRLTVFAAALALVFATGAALAADPGPAAAPKGPEGLLRCLRVVGLTDDQKADIKEILDAEKDVLKGLFETLKTDREALKAAMAQVPQDPCKVGAAFVKVDGDLRATHAELVKIRTNVAAVLTPEQKAKLAGCLAVVDGNAVEGEGDAETE